MWKEYRKDSGSKSSVSELNQRFCSERQAWNSAIMLQLMPQTNEEQAKDLETIQEEFTALSPQYQALEEDALARSMTAISARIGDYRTALVEPFAPHFTAAGVRR